MIVIVGGGLAGLTAARVLFRERAPFLLLEREQALGGRVRTDVTPEGFRLDRGFQMLFTRYPAVRRHLDLQQLGLCPLSPGAVIFGPGGEREELADPFRVPAKVWKTLRSPVLSLADKGRIALEAADLRLRIAEGIWTDRDTTTHAYLHQRGFSEAAIERVFRPIFGGIFLDHSLNTSSNAFRFAFKMLAEGYGAVPALGMGEIARQLAAPLPPASMRLGAAVTALLREGGRVAGVRTGGETHAADAVILAVDSPTAAAFSGAALPTAGNGVTTLYFAGAEPLTDEPRLLLNADPEGTINAAVQISNVAPQYAPAGEHLLSVTMLGNRDEPDDDLEAKARTELSGWFGNDPVSHQRLLSLSRIAFGQFPQPAGFAEHLPPVRGEPGLYHGGEYTRAASINGAIEAGEAAARAALEDLGSTPARRA
ncbi:MAG TPA: NAD(P)/FAD-dependent oxidoreductase [Dehalococcoidia bacterium]|nr:NAD(P)/FAD-dependent oxidoreductase [Dehalococcoidia bacterium]